MISYNQYPTQVITCFTNTDYKNYLFDDKKYKGRKISDMSDRDLLKAIVELVDNIDSIKEEFEFDLLDNKKEINKYKTLFKTKKDFLKDLVEIDARKWLKELPLYEALVKEIEKRKLSYFLEALLERREK